jgi:hypothetical protein
MGDFLTIVSYRLHILEPPIYIFLKTLPQLLDNEALATPHTL